MENFIQAEITKIDSYNSKYGGQFYYVFFKDKKKRSWKTCIYPKMRNFKRWKPFLKKGTWLNNLTVKDIKKRLIDADSYMSEFKMPIQINLFSNA